MFEYHKTHWNKYSATSLRTILQAERNGNMKVVQYLQQYKRNHEIVQMFVLQFLCKAVTEYGLVITEYNYGHYIW